MKITIDIDCTPREARGFLGLPDVEPMQAAMMAEIQRRMTDGLNAMDADALVKQWLPAGLQGWEAMQKMFWNQMKTAAGPDGDARGGADKGGTDKGGGGERGGD